LFYHTIDDKNLVKLGFSHDIKRRESEFKKLLKNLKLIAIKECNSIKDENNLKYELKLKCKHYENEVFYLDKNLYHIFINFNITINNNFQKESNNYDLEISNNNLLISNNNLNVSNNNLEIEKEKSNKEKEKSIQEKEKTKQFIFLNNDLTVEQKFEFLKLLN